MLLLTLLKFAFDIESLGQTLPVMGKGMLGIFVVTSLIIITIYLLQKFASGKKS